MTLRRLFATALAAMAFTCLPLLSPAAAADNQAEFRGCVVNRTDTAITLDTSGDEQVTIDTTWISQAKLGEALADDCVTVKAVIVDGRFMAESIEAGDE